MLVRKCGSELGDPATAELCSVRGTLLPFYLRPTSYYMQGLEWGRCRRSIASFNKSCQMLDAYVRTPCARA